MIIGIIKWWIVWIIIGCIVAHDLKGGLAWGTVLNVIWLYCLWLLGNFPVAMVMING